MGRRKNAPKRKLQKSEKVYYRLNEIAEKFRISQEAMTDILLKNGIKPVLPGIYDRDSFRGKVRNIQKMSDDYRNTKRQINLITQYEDGYISIKEIAEIIGTDITCVRRKLNKLKLSYISGIHGERRYHKTAIEKYYHVLKRNGKIARNRDELRRRGYIPFSEFVILAGITRPTLRKRINDGIYTDCIMCNTVGYIHVRNLNVQPVRNSSITENTPSGYIPLMTVKDMLNLNTLSVQPYIDRGIINPLYVIRIKHYVYLKREEAERFIQWYRNHKLEYENTRDRTNYRKSTFISGTGVVLSDYDIFSK